MIPTPPDGIPWLAWALVVVAIAAIGSLPGVVAALVSRRDMGAIKAQVQNTHTSNLREDLDTAVESATTASAAATLASDSAHRTERYVEDLNKSIRAIEHSLDRNNKLHEDAIDEVRADIDRVSPMITEALLKHLHDCPLRQDQ